MSTGSGLPLAIPKGTLNTMRDSDSKKSDARYRGLLEAAPDAMVVVNAGGKFVLLNVQAENQFGCRRDELIGKKVTTIIPQGFAIIVHGFAERLISARSHILYRIGHVGYAVR
jgi:PAS domain S-box-containing protein